MNKKLEIIKSNLTRILYFIFIILGFIIFSFLIYIKFLRERLPRDIPFELTEFKFYILFFILIGYLYAIKQLIYYKPPGILSRNLLSFISIPFVSFDSFVKHNKVIYPYYYKLFCYIAKILKKSFIIQDRLLLYIIFQLIPKIILLSIFIIDVFWLNKIEIFYYFLILGILPLLYNYFIYSIEFALEQYTQYLESYYNSVLLYEKGNNRVNDMYVDDSCPNTIEALGIHNPNAIYHDEFVSIREYIKIQAEIIMNYDPNNEKTNYEYSGVPFSKEEFHKQYRKDNNKINGDLNENDYEKLHQNFDMLEAKLVICYIFLHLTKKIQELTFIKQIKLLKFIIYFIIWTYILMISIHTLQDLPLTLKTLKIITKYAEHSELFSELDIE